MTAPSHAADSSAAAPDDVLRVLEAVARTWEGSGGDAYAGALIQRGGYMAEDASEEARHVGALMRREYLTPCVLQGPIDSLAALRAAVEAERRAIDTPAIFVLGAGNIGLPLILNACVGLVAGKVVYARASTRNVDAVRAWTAALDAVCEGASAADLGPLARAVRDRVVLLEAHHDTPGYGEELARLPVQQAYLWGGDEALRRTADLLAPQVRGRTYFFGPRTGVLLLECAWWRTRSAAEKRALSQALHDNLVKFDAALCNSPTLGVVVGAADEARAVLDELAGLATPERTERQRLERLPGAGARRRQMRRWLVHGYSLHGVSGGLVTLALGTLDAYRSKNRYLPPPGAFHESAGSLELLLFQPEALDRAAALVAGLQHEPRYERQLWSVGHVVTAASDVLARRLVGLVGEAQRGLRAGGTEPHMLDAADLRVVDIRGNLGRAPGERFDGISLASTMLEPAASLASSAAP